MSKYLKYRKCVKCGAGPSEGITLHRFPRVGKTHGIDRACIWAKVCYPNEDYHSTDFLNKLRLSGKLLCSKHFRPSFITTKGLAPVAFPEEDEELIAYRNVPNGLIKESHKKTPNKMIEESHPKATNKLIEESHPITPNKLIEESHQKTLNKMIEESHPKTPNKMIEESHPKAINKLIEENHPKTPNKLIDESHHKTPNNLIEESFPKTPLREPGRCWVEECVEDRPPFHPFPEDFELFEAWRKRVGNPIIDEMPSIKYEVCDAHFNKHNRSLTSKTDLLEYSIPTINVPGFSGLLTKKNSFLYPLQPAPVSDDENFDAIMDSVSSPLAESENIQNVINTGQVKDSLSGQQIVKKKRIKKYILQQMKRDRRREMRNAVHKFQNLEPRPPESRSCVVCSTTNQYFISLDGDEGKQNDIFGKISAYLPIKVSQQDMVCFPCATSLISFHNLVTSCKKAYGILTDSKNEDNDKSVNDNLDPEQSCEEELIFECVQENDFNIANEGTTKYINESILKMTSNVSHTLEVYDECFETDSITEEPCHTKMTVCSYNWKEINNIRDSNSQGPYTCHLCCECLPNVSRLYDHFKACSKHVCSRCLDVIGDVRMLKEHLKLCYKYACYICPAKFRLMSALVTHQEQNHSTSMCDLCHQTFLNDLECEEHKLHKHKFLCELCNSAFESTIEGVRYRHSIIPDDRLLCLSCYGVYNCTVKINEATTYHVKDKPVVCNVSKQICDKATSTDELVMFTDDSFMFGGIDVTVSTSEYESTAVNFESFNCQTCGRMFDSRTELSDHNCTTENHLVHPNDHLYAKVEDLLKCTYCPKKFASNKYLKMHIFRKHPGSTCPVCASSFKFEEELKKHKNYHCVLECGDCGKKCNGKISMSCHAKLHSDQRYICDTCGKQFFDQNRFLYHIRINHTQEEEFICCSACGILINKYKYAGHFSRNHKDQNLHQCHLCLKNFKSSKSLRIHSKLHNLLRPFTCTLCPSIFRAEKYLIKHVAKCHHPTHNVCRFCMKVFQSIEEFDQHFTEDHESFSKFILLANGEGYHCSHCDQIFDSSQSMFAHSKEINKEVRNSQQHNFKCAHCERDFSTKYSLLNHIRCVHKLERDFKCSYCPDKFKHKDAKKAHERIHTGEKPFSCSVCDKKFRNKRDMKRHEARHKTEPAFYGNTLGNDDSISDGSKRLNTKEMVEMSRVDSALIDWPWQEDY